MSHAQSTVKVVPGSTPPAANMPLAGYRSSFRMRLARGILILALLPVGALYLGPRVYNLTATPYRLDEAVVHADKYNPRLAQVANEEKVTADAFSTLDRVDGSVSRVRAADAAVGNQLSFLIAQIRGDLQDTLTKSDTQVQGLAVALKKLEANAQAAEPGVIGARHAVDADRASLGQILTEARSTAARVHDARTSADRSAQNVSGH